MSLGGMLLSMTRDWDNPRPPPRQFDAGAACMEHLREIAKRPPGPDRDAARYAIEMLHQLSDTYMGLPRSAVPGPSEPPPKATTEEALFAHLKQMTKTTEGADRYATQWAVGRITELGAPPPKVRHGYSELKPNLTYGYTVTWTKLGGQRLKFVVSGAPTMWEAQFSAYEFALSQGWTARRWWQWWRWGDTWVGEPVTVERHAPGEKVSLTQRVTE